MKIEDNIPTIEIIFDQWRGILGPDYQAYKNHVYRVFNFCTVLYQGSENENKMFAIAGCFHDIGIWENNTFDYLEPSIELVKKYLDNSSMSESFRQIELMILFHHKITSYKNTKYPLVEIFRKADWIDVTKGKRSFGLSKNDVGAILEQFPNNGFHKKLIQLTKDEFKKKPFNPLPMAKW